MQFTLIHEHLIALGGLKEIIVKHDFGYYDALSNTYEVQA